MWQLEKLFQPHFKLETMHIRNYTTLIYDTSFIFIAEKDGVRACLPVLQVSPVEASRPAEIPIAFGTSFKAPCIH